MVESQQSSPAEQPDPGRVLLEREGPVATLTLDRPAALNALTWSMYEQLAAHLRELAHDASTRVVLVRGAGTRAFAAGSDIRQFEGFTGADGVAYEQRLDAIFNAVAALPQAVIAAISGYAVGAGLLLAAACDLRYAPPSAQLGAPIARTLGNCLSFSSIRRLVTLLGEMRVKELLFTARLVSAEEAARAGFLTDVLDEADFFTQVQSLAWQIADRAPLTLWATKETIRRLRAAEQAQQAHTDIDVDDIVARVYGSADFREGVRAHIEKRRPAWQGK